ncbi:TetR/AcrR family transcriptional regulator C-terminal domain-containing protein [Cohnella sp. REN36]|uniref:TetR/AcrR family transcriptional regulator C-terminal domain-containing protein n=1 Tax=Cohnella sp. REN36 TaxID=2887347 RepID=UPI001D138E01|nr:TetR/AcrR family transcriptional regulator C-terminal domain-containing protein [Cohnella sp. REN36]MCC3372732.1 TetR/AcrR family transcriptional regulator C-terminal domain-containing protein [Cohnella sp. REN36]
MARRRVRPAREAPVAVGEEALHIPLDRTRILHTALQLLQEEGLKALSMRKVADALQVKTASLYYHVKDKDQLLSWIADRISAELGAFAPQGNWRERLEGWGAYFRQVLLRYRDAPEIFHSHLAAGYGRLAEIERVYGMFAEAGFPDPWIPWLSSMLKNYVLSFVAEELRLRAFAGKGEDAAARLGEAYTRFYRELPPETFPHVIRLAAHTAESDGEAEFRFGLRVLLDGFAAQRPSDEA